MRIAIVSGFIILIVSFLINLVLQNSLNSSGDDNVIISILIIIAIHTSFILGGLVYLIKRFKK